MESVCEFLGPFSDHILPAGHNCYMDFFGIIFTIFYTCFLLCIALYINNSNKYLISTERPRYSLHYLRCCLQIFLALTYILEMGAYFVTLERRQLPIASLLIPIIQLICLLVGLYFHHTIEKRRIMYYNLLETLINSFILVWRLFNLITSMQTLPYSWKTITYPLYTSVCVLLVLISLSDSLAYRIEIKFNKDEVKINGYSGGSGGRSTSYRHNLVNGFSQMTFWWLNPLLLSGYQEPIELEDLGRLPRNECADVQFKKFMKIYNEQVIYQKNDKTKKSLWMCINAFIWRNFYLGGMFKLFGDMVGLVGPLGISGILDYIVKQNETIVTVANYDILYPTIGEFVSNGYVIGIIVLVAAIAQGTFSQCSTHLVNIEGIRLKSALQSLIYNKCLKLSSWAAPCVNAADDEVKVVKFSNNGDRRRSSNKMAGDDDNMDASSITNLMSEDSFNIMSFIWIGHYVWAIPLKIGVIMCLLYIKLGISAIIGAMICILTMTPLQFYIGKKMSANSKKTADFSDVRLMKINEVFQGIKVLKMYGWESVYGDKIHEARKQELELLNWDSFYWAIITFLTHASSVLITLVTFGLYFVLEEDLMNPAKVFAGLALFNQLTVPLFIFPVTLPIIISAMVSVQRVEEFLDLSEINEPKCDTVVRKDSKEIKISEEDVMKIDKYGMSLDNILEAEENENDDVFKDNSSDKNSSAGSSFEENKEINKANNAIVIKHAVLTWGDRDAFTKINIENIDIMLGKLTMVIGRTGSGKTSFLSAIIKEMNLIDGDIQWSNESPIAYVSQSPWLTNSTIRDNILFGRTMRARRYRRVLAACSLHADLSAHIARDLTSVNVLSGGQRQRVALARALYSKAKILILDDPLSALDHTVAQKVFEKGIKRTCEKNGRTVIMVTHRYKYLSQADQIIHVDNGKVSALGTLAEIEKSNPELIQEWLKMFNSASSIKEKEKPLKINWQLLKIANKAARNLNSGEDNVECNKDELDSGTFVPLKKRLSGFQGSRYFTHDLVLPTDECDDEVLRTTVPKRSSTRRRKIYNSCRIEQRRHKTAERSSSLQVGKNKVKPAPMVRQQSSPAIRCPYGIKEAENMNDDKTNQKYLLRNILSLSPQKLLESQNEEVPINRQRSIIKRLLSRSSTKSKRTSSTSNDSEHTPVKRILSTNSAMSEDYADDDVFYSDTITSNLMPDEEREYGKISKKVYLEYMRASGYFLSALYIFSSLGWQILRTYTDLWLSEWTRIESELQHSEKAADNVFKYFGIYSILSTVSIITSFTSNVVGQYAGAKARDNLHTKLLNCIILCPLSFFEKTPLGRLMNRFSTDIGIIDKKIATSIQRLMQFLFLCVSAILINAVITPWFIVISIPITLLYYIIQKFYRRSARELQRLDAITKSPVFSHFGETISGLSSIRAYGHQERFMNTLWTKMDVNTNAFIILNSNNRWLGIALDYLGGVIVFVAIYTALITAKLYPQSVSPSLAGLAINYTLLVPIYLNWVVKFLSDLEMYMSAVERVQQYSTMASENFEGTALPPNWPNKGQVTFSGVTLRYDESSEPVISKLDLQISAGQKVAICGRTGSGKTTLAMSLLRMVEIFEGNIFIDGIDIKSADLRTLRSRLAVVPQEGILYGGTLRDNLTPEKNSLSDLKAKKISKIEKSLNFLEVICNGKINMETSDNFQRLSAKCDGNIEKNTRKTDSDVWEILEKVQLKKAVSSHPAGLDCNINEGGTGWSAGEKQQLCIARALLKSCSVVILDEPTSALDPATEADILPALNKSGKTVITIAHRLSTIMEYDRVLVIEEGRIIEDGSPKELLLRPMSIFASMFRASEG